MRMLKYNEDLHPTPECSCGKVDFKLAKDVFLHISECSKNEIPIRTWVKNYSNWFRWNSTGRKKGVLVLETENEEVN